MNASGAGGTPPTPPFPGSPPGDVPNFVDRDVLQADGAEQLGHARRAVTLGSRRGRDRAQRRLARQRHLVGALDVMARGADALMPEQARDGLIHPFTLTGLTVPGERATLGSWTSVN